MLLNPYRFGVSAISAPTDVFGCSSWFDGRYGVTDAGSGAVSAWNDQSGNGFHLGVSTGSARPTTGVDTLNGLNVIKFDGGDWIGRAASWIYTSTNTTTFIVAKSAATPASTAIILQESSDTDVDTRYNRSPSVDQAFLIQTDDGGTTRLVVNGGVINTNWHLWTIKDTSTNASVAIDRGTPTSVAYTRGGSTMNRTTLGASRQQNNPIATFLTGDIATIISYDAVLSAGNTTLVENYILATWGI